LERRRHRALTMLAAGDPPVDVAPRLGVHRRSVHCCKAAHRTGGIAGVRAKAVPGRPPKVTAK
jgi:transposase